MELIRRVADRRGELARLREENTRLRRLLDAERCGRARDRHAACHDPLTGLPNRRDFYQRAGVLVAGSSAAAVMMLDLDGFKPVNDGFGHAAGDVVLVAVARRMAARLGGRWLVARLGGDEFAAACAGPVAEAGLVAEAAALATAVAEPVHLDGGLSARVGCSVGLAVAGTPIGLPELLRRADAALYRSKMLGVPVLWHPRRDDDAQHRPGWRPVVRTRDLRRARYGATSVLVAADATDPGGLAARLAVMVADRR